MLGRDSMYRCLITGAGGFLGKALLKKLLGSGLFVRSHLRSHSSSVSSQSQEIVRGELEPGKISFDALLDGIDTVFHLASTAHSSADTAQYRTDCESTLLLAREAEKRGVQRFVFVSSTRAMASPGSIMIDESYCEWPKDDYGYWKRTTEKKLLEEIYIPHLAIVRPCLIYGTTVKGNLHKMIKAIASGYFPLIQESNAERSMVGVNDVSSALVVAATHPDANRHPLIVSDGQPYTLYRMHCEVLAALGKSRPEFLLPLWFMKYLGVTGDRLQFIWPGCPLNSDVVSKLTGSAAYSAAEMRKLGWQPTTTFYEELPVIIDSCLGRRS